VTTIFTDALIDPHASTPIPAGVYPPQQDSALLIAALQATGRAAGSRVADLCSGSGVVAMAAAVEGAACVTAFEMSPEAVACTRANVAAATLNVTVHHGCWTGAVRYAPFDVVTCNPPYVPHVPGADRSPIPLSAGPETAWNAGPDGRRILDPLCRRAPELLAAGGTMLIVQSEFADVKSTVQRLRRSGLRTEVVAEQWIPFGPVLTARAGWLERTGRLDAGRRRERLAVVRADRL
jgi:release factor glutamine methyltransferase